MSNVTVYLDTDDQQVFLFCPKRTWTGQKEVSVPAETLARWQEVARLFDAVQDEIATVYTEASRR